MNDHGSTSSSDHSSTTDLVTGVISDARDLALAHVDGLRIEAKEELARLASATRLAAIGLALFSIAAILVAFGAAHALAALTAVPLWASFLILAGVFLAIGGGLVMTAKARKGNADGVPEGQLASAKRDAAWVAGRANDAVS